MKKTFAMLMGATFLMASVSPAQNIIFEETTTTSKLIINADSLSVQLGSIELARPYAKMASGSVRVGSEVITSDNRAGVVSAIFLNDSKIVVRDGYYGNRTWSLDKIAVTSGCIGPFCVEDEVVTSDNRPGIVKGYFNSGKIVVWDSYYGNRTWDTHRVAAAFGCIANYCTGDKVVTSDNRNGVISAFFANGKIVVQDPYYGNRTWNADRVAMTTAICTNIYIQRPHLCGY